MNNVFAVVVHVPSGLWATEVLNALNVEARWVKFQFVRDRVFVTLSVPAKPFVPAHLRRRCRFSARPDRHVFDMLSARLNATNGR
jgi:hypothetical protein